jgi:hypothetical protein
VKQELKASDYYLLKKLISWRKGETRFQIGRGKSWCYKIQSHAQ